MSMKPTEVSIGDLLYQRMPFEVPKYQRAYAWDRTNIKDFVRDLLRLCIIAAGRLDAHMPLSRKGIVCRVLARTFFVSWTGITVWNLIGGAAGVVGTLAILLSDKFMRWVVSVFAWIFSFSMPEAIGWPQRITVLGLFLLVLFVLSYLWNLTIEGTHLEGKLRELESGSISLPELLRDKFGYKIAWQKATFEIEDLEGNCTLVTEKHDIEVVGGQTIPHFPNLTQTGSPGKVTPVELIKLPGSPKDISMHVVEQQENFCRFHVEVAGGGLTKRDGPLSYRYRTRVSKGFCMTKEEAAEAYKNALFKNEHAGPLVVEPIDELVLEMRFPAGYNVTLYPGAFISDREYFHDEEVSRIKDGLTRTERGGSLKIKNPLLGFHYVLYWTPPSTAEVQKLSRARNKDSTPLSAG